MIPGSYGETTLGFEVSVEDACRRYALSAGWVVDDKSFRDDRWAGMFFSVIQSGPWGNYLSGEYCLSPILSLSDRWYRTAETWRMK